MAEPKDPDALTDDRRAPVLSEDQAETPLDDEDGESSAAIGGPVEENDFNAQPG